MNSRRRPAIEGGTEGAPLRDSQPRFQDVSARVDFPALDARILKFWKDHGIFEKSLEGREDAPLYVFYEGPPDGQRQARLAPRHRAHLQGPLPALQDDARLPRAAQGRLGHARPAGGARGRAPPRHRRQGPDRGLRRRRVQPAVQGERDRLPRGVGATSPSASASGWTWTTRTTPSPTTTSSRCGGSCGRSGTRTCCTRATRSCRTARAAARAISSHEVAQGYKDVTEDSIYVRFPLDGGVGRAGGRRDGRRRRRRGGIEADGEPKPVSLAVWTTTPWTLISNVAAAVRADVTYALVESRGERFVLARDLVGEGARQEGRGAAGVPGRRAARPGVRGAVRLHGAGQARPLRHRRRLRHDHGRHRHRAHRPGLRRGRHARRRGERPAGGQRRRHRGQVRRRGHAVGRRLRQGRRPGHHRRPQGPRPAARRRALRAQLPVLLALRHGAALLQQGHLVRAHDGDQGRAHQVQRRRDLAPGAHQDRALRRVARRQRRLGAQPRPLLGHAAAHLALRAGAHALRRVHRGAQGDGGRSRSRGSGTPPALRRRRRAHLPRLRRRDAPRPGGHRRLVRLRLHAVRASGTTRSRTRSSSASASPPTTSARPSTRRAAGSTACSPSPRSSRAAAPSSASSVSATSSTPTARR